MVLWDSHAMQLMLSNKPPPALNDSWDDALSVRNSLSPFSRWINEINQRILTTFCLACQIRRMSFNVLFHVDIKEEAQLSALITCSTFCHWHRFTAILWSERRAQHDTEEIAGALPQHMEFHRCDVSTRDIISHTSGWRRFLLFSFFFFPNPKHSP